MTDFSKDKLLEFLDFLGNKGLMNKATIASRKAAANTFLGILEPDEAKDLRTVNLDEIALRFSNLKGSEFKPESIKVYKSRVSSAIADLKRYRSNPLTFKPSIVLLKPASSVKSEKEQAKPPVSKSTSGSGDSSEVIFPIPIRPDVVIKIVGVPSNLTKKEAAKIANVISALAIDDETRQLLPLPKGE